MGKIIFKEIQELCENYVPGTYYLFPFKGEDIINK